MNGFDDESDDDDDYKPPQDKVKSVLESVKVEVKEEK